MGARLDAVVEAGVDFVALEIADDQQRRILEIVQVLKQLLAGFFEVLVFALVFPGEVAFEPDVGEALRLSGLEGLLAEERVFEHVGAFGVFRDAFLEGEGLAGGVELSRRFVSDQAAEVDEVFAVRRGFLERGGAPFFDEGLRGEVGHGGMIVNGGGFVNVRVKWSGMDMRTGWTNWTIEHGTTNFEDGIFSAI